MNVLKICIGTWENASRDKRELSVIQELGAEVEVIAKGEVSGQVDEVAGFRVTRLSTRPVKSLPVSINRVLSIFTWAAFVRRMHIDVISGHDYIALFIGWLSNIGKRKKAVLVYDSHEFELGRNQNRSRLAYWVVCHLERFLMKRCAFSIMVNDTIADEVQRIHRLPERPVVVRNIPPYWELDPEAIRATRCRMLGDLGAADDTFLMMYHGGVMGGRGVENMLKAVARLSGVSAVVLGNGEPHYMASLHALCDELGISNRVLFHPAVPVENLRNFVGAADAGMSLLTPVVQNHIFALPNKFFENIQSLTPVIVSDFPTIGAIVDQYQIGLKVDPENVDEIAAAIERMRTDREFYNACKDHLKQAKEDLSWEKEKRILREAYGRILT